MRKNTAFRIAASALGIGVTTIGCTPAGFNPATVSANAPKAEKDAGKLHARSLRAVSENRLADAVIDIEKAVSLSPRDLGYRMVLGDIYLKSGRFVSAQQAFTDVLVLDPGNVRASLSLALTQIALGNSSQALATLNSLAGTAAPGDLGLAYALAGQPQRAIEMLEPAARSAEATGRIRQNLALAYALAGNWQKARIVAAHDVSPADLADRLQQWAALAQPEASHSQVAALLGVTDVVEDSGQPTALALAPQTAEPIAMAAAEATPAPVAVEAPAPVAISKIDLPASIVTPQQTLAQAVAIDTFPAATSAPIAAEQVSKAVRSLVKPEAPVTRSAVQSAPLPAFKPAAERTSFEPVPAKKPVGRFVVQIGAFKTAVQVEKAWNQAQQRYSLGGHEPVSTTVDIAGKGRFHRLSVSGFGTSSEAGRFCGAIRAKGGACFVRTNAGDAPVVWASRKSGRGG